MAVDISNLPISSSFQDLVLVSGSYLQNATGSVLTDVEVTASMATTASFAITASYALNTEHVTASYALSSSHAERADTASVAISADAADIATSASFATTASHLEGAVATASYAYTASVLIGAIESASFASTASLASRNLLTASNEYSEISVEYGDGITGTLDVTPRQVIESVINKESITLDKGTPVYVSGSTGNASNIYKADASTTSRMPAAYVLNQTLAAGAEGQALLAGFINGVDTSTFEGGDAVYVAVGGGYTNVKPTGSALIQKLGNVIKKDANGSGVITGAGRSNDVPNIASGYVWMGNEDQVATAVSTASLSVGNATSASHAESASIADSIKDGIDVSFNSGSFNDLTATTLAVTNFTAVTSSVVITGDAFIRLNNDTPVQRYAGIIVQDSGSNTSASLQYDGGTDDWFYEYEGDDPTNFGVVMFGPEYAVKGTPSYPTANTIVKGNGGHHLIDTSIVDDGSSVTIGNVIVASAGISGSLHGDVTGNATSASFAEDARTADTATSASEAVHAATATTASHATSIPGVISNDITFNGSVNGGVTALSIASNTASIDMSAGNFFTLSMPAGGAVHITATNKKAGQTINLQTTQNATAATLDWNASFKFESGSQFAASTGSGAIDLMSFVTFDTSNVLGTGINNLV